MESILVIVHLFLAIGLVGLILIQHGKGADMGPRSARLVPGDRVRLAWRIEFS